MTTPVGSAGSSLESLARSGSPLGARRVAREFEALLLGEMLKAAGRPLAGSSLLDGGAAGRMYRELFMEEIAQRVAARGGFGLASAIERDIIASQSAERKESPGG